jgi:hypothetical protein
MYEIKSIPKVASIIKRRRATVWKWINRFNQIGRPGFSQESVDLLRTWRQSIVSLIQSVKASRLLSQLVKQRIVQVICHFACRFPAHDDVDERTSIVFLLVLVTVGECRDPEILLDSVPNGHEYWFHSIKCSMHPEACCQHPPVRGAF